MCGIVGYAGFPKRISLNKSIAAIYHRGPDDQGVEYFDGVALGNTRLSIHDLSRKGHQPMFNEDKSLCVVFNGEIYNFREVKKQFKDYKFNSDSDTEVLMYAYQKWGVKCLEKIEGMFSFVIYDRKNNQIFGARDRLGQKPLKYYYKNNQLIFASEIKAILPLLNSKLEIDETAIDNFLSLQYIPSPSTGFKNIYKLPPAHYFLYKNNKLSIKKYWELDFTKKLELTEDECIDQIYELLNQSVKSHLTSDVPIGALLSGGLDSSLIVALMSKHTSNPFYTFNIGFNDTKYDESSYAKQVSKLYHTKHSTLKVTENDLINNIKKVSEILDEPLADNSILPMFLVSKLTSSKVKVALTGDGGDENFAGYDRYYFILLAKIMGDKLPFLSSALSKLSIIHYNLHSNRHTELQKRFLTSYSQHFPKKYLNYNSFFLNSDKHQIYNKNFLDSINQNETYKIFDKFINTNTSDLDKALKIDINTYLPDDLLYKSDISSMANGLELRSPFLDHNLMELVAKIPFNKKIRFKNKKYILKKLALKKNLLPQEIVNRPKQGFIMPLNKWFKGNLKEYLKSEITGSKEMNLIFDNKKLDKYLELYFNNKLYSDNNIFALLMLSKWLSAYFK